MRKDVMESLDQLHNSISSQSMHKIVIQIILLLFIVNIFDSLTTYAGIYFAGTPLIEQNERMLYWMQQSGYYDFLIKYFGTAFFSLGMYVCYIASTEKWFRDLFGMKEAKTEKGIIFERSFLIFAALFAITSTLIMVITTAIVDIGNMHTVMNYATGYFHFNFTTNHTELSAVAMPTPTLSSQSIPIIASILGG